jgi:hypothetical protein
VCFAYILYWKKESRKTFIKENLYLYVLHVSGTVHGQMMVSNHHMILARRATFKQWQHGWRTGDAGRLDLLIQSDLWSHIYLLIYILSTDLCLTDNFSDT